MRPDRTRLGAEAAVGGLSTLADVPMGALLENKNLKRLLAAVCGETGSRRLALQMCRTHPRTVHPWLKALRSGRPTGAQQVFTPLFRTVQSEKLAIIAEVIRRLEKKP